MTPDTTSDRERPILWPSALLLVLGSLVFIAGGRQHPVTDHRLGPLGTPEYLLAFVDSILATPGWVPMHLLILAGPVWWALAIPGVRQTLPRRADAVWSAAVGALVLSATLWVVGFVLDTWIAPYYTRAIREAPTPEAARALLAVFGANQNLLVRFGLVSLVIGGLATAAVSVAERRRPARRRRAMTATAHRRRTCETMPAEPRPARPRHDRGGAARGSQHRLRPRARSSATRLRFSSASSRSGRSSASRWGFACPPRS